MLINVNGKWLDSESIVALLPAEDNQGHANVIAAVGVDAGLQVALHDDHERYTPDEFAAYVADLVNTANSTYPVQSSSVDLYAEQPDPQQPTDEQKMEAYFAQGWSALAKDLIRDFYIMLESDSVIDGRWFQDWFISHGLLDLANEVRMDLAQEHQAQQSEKEQAIAREQEYQQNLAADELRAAGFQVQAPPARHLAESINEYDGHGHAHGTPDATGFSAEAITPALRDDVRRLLAEQGPVGLSAALARLIADQRPEQD